MRSSILGELTPREFLRTYWQRKPLFVRGAVPSSALRFDRTALLRLALRDDVESRLVRRTGERWAVQHGPLSEHELQRLPARGWTLLIHGVDLHCAAARALMTWFDFIPHARQDDLMVSIAPPGGGVGPHFDSYDVFLLQASGTKRWRIGAQRDLRLVEQAPLKILRAFTPTRTFCAGPGDLLYLPPQYAHEGVALDAGLTCSIGFRAPTAQELATAFLDWLRDAISIEGRYADPDLAPQRHPALVPQSMLDQVERMLARVDWRRRDVAHFLGQYLTEPKPNVWFVRPVAALTFRQFCRRIRMNGLRLALKTRMLLHARNVFVNGNVWEFAPTDRASLLALADRRRVAASAPLTPGVRKLFYDWYLSGYVELP